MWDKEKIILKKLNKLKDVNGRLELVKIFPNNIKILLIMHIPPTL